MKKTLLVVMLLLAGCQFHKAPNGIYFPYGWGKPPEIQTKDHVKLPDDYGYGRYLIRWADFDVYDYYSACELEVLCE